MRNIEHSIDIPAPIEHVRQVLSDTDDYSSWNPFMTHVEGRFVTGRRISVTIRPGGRTMTFRPRVTAAGGDTIRWQGRLGVRGIFDGAHELHLAINDQGGTTFTQRERFSGVLVPFMRRVLDDTDAGFVAMNAALRDRVVELETGMRS